MTMLHDLITAKPLVGYTLAGSGFVAGVLTFLQILTPILGFGAAVVGFIAGIYTLRSAHRNWKQGKNKVE